MPHANIWIRREDWEKWESIPNKAEWLHTQLSPPGVKTYFQGEDIAIPEVREKARQYRKEELAAIRDPLVEQAIAAFSGSLKQCKDGHAIPKGRERCLAKGCKYS